MFRILVIDSEPAMASIIERWYVDRIDRGELSFEFRSDGWTGLEALRGSTPYDVLLLDTFLDDLDFRDILDELGELDQSALLVIVVSSFEDLDDVRTAMDHGASEYLIRPFSFQELDLRLNKILQLAERLRSADRFREELDLARREKDRQQKEFSRLLLDSMESERKRIASELHDGIGQNILLMKNLAMLDLPQVDIQRRERRLTEISDLASSSIEEVRSIAHNLRPFHIDRFGLMSAVDVMLQKIAQSSGIDIKADLDSIGSLPRWESAIHVFRIIQELMTNSIKHSGATRIECTVRRQPHALLVRVTDDGCGFEAPNPGSYDVRSPQGFGLFGIGERVRMLGGAFRMESRPGKGSTFSVLVPFPRAHD